MINQLKVSSSPYFSQGSKGNILTPSHLRLEESTTQSFPNKYLVSDLLEDYYSCNNSNKLTGNVLSQAVNLRTRSCSESTTLSQGLYSPRSTSQQTT